MGTSSSFGGPSGRNPLLPPWAQGDGGLPLPPQSPPVPPMPPELIGQPPGSPGEAPAIPLDISFPSGDLKPPSELAPVNPGPELPRQTVPLPAVSWTSAKRRLTAYTSRGDKGSLRAAANRYVGARGGGKQAARSARAGRSISAQVGGFLSDVASRGFAEAARALGLSEHLGKSVDEVLAAIANALAPDGATQEEAVARMAVNETLIFLYDRLQLADGNIQKLDSMDGAAVTEALGVSVTSYIYHRWVQELGQRIEQNAVSAERAVRLERDIKAYIVEAVQLDFSKIDPLTIDWKGGQGQRIIEQIYADAYTMLEGEQ